MKNTSRLGALSLLAFVFSTACSSKVPWDRASSAESIEDPHAIRCVGTLRCDDDDVYDLHPADGVCHVMTQHGEHDELSPDGRFINLQLGIRTGHWETKGQALTVWLSDSSVRTCRPPAPPSVQGSDAGTSTP